ncbi:MAG: ABC transporter permease, partial [Draconibacterium sp.]|nr:ABC transporter permease [Draconibacterium sp.]
MFRNFIKTAIRNLLRNKFYSLINIVGLAIGITACILIMLYVESEVSYDKFHEKADRIYRVNLYAILKDDEINQSVTSAPLANAIQEEIPAVELSARISGFTQPVIRHNNEAFNERKWYFVDENFFRIFTTSFILGNPDEALSMPNTVVLSETTAKRFFGNENPVGKYLTWENDRDYTITGVIKDFPESSHFKPDFLASIKGQAIDKDMTWVNNQLFTYYLIAEGFTKDDVDAGLDKLVEKYVGPAVKQYMGVDFETLKSQGLKYKWYSQPLSDIHFNREVAQDLEPRGNRSYMIIFSIIAIFILVIACINYMNMSTARSANRAKEVGIKKSLGSNRNYLIRQFLAESVFVTIIAMILAMVFIKVFLPGFNNLIDKQLAFSYFDNLKTIPLMIAFGVLVGIIAGSYPSFFLASFSPVKVMKGTHKSEGSHARLRNGLVIFQLIVSIVLFSGTFFISKQLSFLQNQELGFKKENLIVIEKANYLGNRLNTFKTELLAQAGINGITNTTTVPGRGFTSSTFYHHTPNDPRGLLTLWTDNDFIDTYQIEMKEGRFFEEGNQSVQRGVVLNESAVKRLNIEDPIGKRIWQQQQTDENALTIIGVMKDFHCESLHKDMASLVVFSGSGENLTVRI